MKIRLIVNITEDKVYFEGEDGIQYDPSDLLVSFKDVETAIGGKASRLCLNNEDDRIQLMGVLTDIYNEIKEEEEEDMQQVPNDAILLTPDEAKAILSYVDNQSMGHDLEDDDLEAAMHALDEQLQHEEEYEG